MKVVASDGVRLSVQESGPEDAPTIVAVHGYPDDHTVWDGVVERLADRFRVVTYDVRGAGASDRPATRAGYRISQLVEDLASVLDAVSPDEPVHLLAHDWGSIASWEAVTDDRFADRLLSFTSISGTSLDQAGAWLRRGHRHPLAALRQLLSSYYVAMFQVPYLPEQLATAGVVGRGVVHSSRLGRSNGAADHVTARSDARDGIDLYRANMMSRLGRPSPRSTSVPVQVLAPTHDAHVTRRLQAEAPAAYVTDLRVRTVEGNHWVVAQRPDLVADLVAEFAEETGGLSDRRAASPRARRP